MTFYSAHKDQILPEELQHTYRTAGKQLNSTEEKHQNQTHLLKLSVAISDSTFRISLWLTNLQYTHSFVPDLLQYERFGKKALQLL